MLTLLKVVILNNYDALLFGNEKKILINWSGVRYS